jgi:HNH endonuclease
VNTVLETPCREYMGPRTHDGYGRRQDQHSRERFSSALVHRQMWEMAHGSIPDGMYVLHACDNPPCFRLDHLFLGTKGDNNFDMSAKGRHGNTRKAACKHGHPFDEANTYILPGGQRGCRTCRRISVKNARSK